jgi:hypothetical protein
VRDVEGPDSTGVSTDDQATRPCFLIASFATPHTHRALPPRCSPTPISYHPLACSLISGSLGGVVEILSISFLCSYRPVCMDYIGVRGVDGPDSTGVSTDIQAHEHAFRLRFRVVTPHPGIPKQHAVSAFWEGTAPWPVISSVLRLEIWWR